MMERKFSEENFLYPLEKVQEIILVQDPSFSLYAQNDRQNNFCNKYDHFFNASLENYKNGDEFIKIIQINLKLQDVSPFADFIKD